MSIDLYTIGFTEKKAEDFFEELKSAGVKRVLDVRLENGSQLDAFAKRDDLAYFLQQLGEMDYHHLAELAPTKEIWDAFKKNKGKWSVYEKAFLKLMKERRIEDNLDKALMHEGCLLCSEHEPHYCHRRLVGEYLQQKWGGDMRIVHLIPPTIQEQSPKKMSIDLYTIGSNEKTAEEFFRKLKAAGVKRVLDVRRNSYSQLTRFTNRNHLPYLLKQIGGIKYRYLAELAPTQEVAGTFKKEKGKWVGDWSVYEKAFLKLMKERHIERLDKTLIHESCLLASEHEPHHCHRRLIGEYLQKKWGGKIRLEHL